MIRPPPGCTSPQIVRTSAPQAERITNNSSRGRIGRSTIAAGGAAAGAAAGSVAGAVAVFGAGVPVGTACLVLGAASGFGAASALGSAGASTARTALAQPGARLAMFFCRHWSEAAPPGGMLEQCAM